MVLRTAVCVSLMLLLTTTTSRPRLFRGLRVLGAPIIFVTLLNMMDRYLGLIVRATEEIHLARISRSIVSSGTREERAWAAAGIGSILRRSNELSNSVHLAMISRGYKGEIYLLYEPRPNVRDYLFLLTILVFIALMLLIG